ncbi:MAG: hypothetical protein WD894_05815 [Pirellulales bacterium]
MRTSSVRVLVVVLFAAAALFANASFAQVESSPKATTPAGLNRDANANQAGNLKLRPNIIISKETTFITEPLRPDGYPDYVRYVDEQLSKGVTPDNNAVVLLLRALGPREISEKHQADFFKRLNIEPLPAQGNYFVDWAKYSARYSAKDWPPVPAGSQQSAREFFESLDEAARERPWTRKDFPALADWLQAHDKHIDQFVAASKRPQMYTPLITGDEEPTLVAVLLPVVQNSRQAARALVTRAMYRAGGGDFNAAVEDLMACHRLARLTAQGFSLIESLVAVAMDHIALDAEAALLSQDKMTAAQRATLRKELAQLPPMRSMANALDRGERLMYLDSVCWIARRGASAMKHLTGMIIETPPGMSDLLANVAGDVLIDWNVPLKVGNEWYDRYVEAAAIEDAKERLKALAAIEADVKATAARSRDAGSVLGLFFSPRFSASQKMADVFIALLLPALNAALNAEHRNGAKLSLVNLGLALADYRDENKRFPDNLDQLAPKHIEKIPLDPMWGDPFLYKKTDNGYLLYGLGQNGQDDGGRTSDSNDGADDLVIAVHRKPEN